MTAATDEQAILTHAFSQAGGMLHLHVVRLGDLAALADRAALHDHTATQLIAVTSRVLKGIVSAARTRPMACSSCSRSLFRKTRFAIVVARPDHPYVENCLTLGICEHCATEPDGIRTKAMEAMREIWPDVRLTINSPHAPGHA